MVAHKIGADPLWPASHLAPSSWQHQQLILGSRSGGAKGRVKSSAQAMRRRSGVQGVSSRNQPSRPAREWVGGYVGGGRHVWGVCAYVFASSGLGPTPQLLARWWYGAATATHLRCSRWAQGTGKQRASLHPSCHAAANTCNLTCVLPGSVASLLEGEEDGSAQVEGRLAHRL